MSETRRLPSFEGSNPASTTRPPSISALTVAEMNPALNPVNVVNSARDTAVW